MQGWTEEGVARAWRALVQQAAGEDWRFVRLEEIGPLTIEAGRQFPLGCEALIVAYPGTWPVNASRFPETKGFDVAQIQASGEFAGKKAIAIVRRPEGSLDMFTTVVVDVLNALRAAHRKATTDLAGTFLDRVDEWLEFMARTHRPLSHERQVGLLGELWFLRMLARTISADSALDCWQGPLRAAQDFQVCGAYVEVKSTARAPGFLALINSIEQLDDDQSKVFLCAQRFEERADGISLVDLVAELRALFEPAGVQRHFDAMLMILGYQEEHASQYASRYALSDVRAFACEPGMPRLTRTALPTAIRSARYTLDIDAIETPRITLVELFAELGLESHEP
jgi:hypothetical protein